MSMSEQSRLSTDFKSIIEVIALSADTFWSRSVDNTRMTDLMDCDSGQSQYKYNFVITFLFVALHPICLLSKLWE